MKPLSYALRGLIGHLDFQLCPVREICGPETEKMNRSAFPMRKVGRPSDVTQIFIT